MEVQIIPKPKEKPKKITIFLMYFSLIVLIVTAGIYLYLRNDLGKKNQELTGLQEALAKKETSRELEQFKKELTVYKEKIDTMSFLFDSYRLGTNFFKFLERYTHPKVKLSSVNVSFSDYKVLLSGQTDNFITLIQQLYIFENNPDIKNLRLVNFSASKDKTFVSFNIEFDLESYLFKF